jgi:hypothetical protein
MKTKLDYLNQATKRYYMQQGYSLRNTIKEVLYNKFLARLPKDAPEYCFGFTGFKPSLDGRTFVGTLLCAIDKTRFFACHLPRVGKTPRPFEYKKGDEFSLTPDEVFSSDDFLEESAAFDVIQYGIDRAGKALIQYVITNVQS